MFRVYFVNHGYCALDRFSTLESAKEFAVRCGFEAVVLQGEIGVASWSIFGGWRSL